MFDPLSYSELMFVITSFTTKYEEYWALVGNKRRQECFHRWTEADEAKLQEQLHELTWDEDMQEFCNHSAIEGPNIDSITQCLIDNYL